MKTKNQILTLIGVAIFALATVSLRAQMTEIPSQITSQLPPGAVAFDINGLSFTNVHFKAATGTEIRSAGTMSYIQGDIDAFKIKGSFDIGFGLEATLSSSGNGFHSASADLEGIKNLSNWQLVGKLGYGRNFEDNVGNFAKAGFDVNYNLTKGAGLAWLGTSGGSFTYVGSGVSFATMDFSLEQKNIEKMWRIYLGYAF